MTLVENNSPEHAIIEEEENTHARVHARVVVGDKPLGDRIGSADIDKQLLELRDAIVEARQEDLPPLVEEMTRLAALRGQLGGSLNLPVDLKSPYFAHMVLEEDGQARDVLIGKRGFIDRSHNIQIVDWRNAPISQIYYRYEEGDEYDEEIAAREVNGVVKIRRNVSIDNTKLRRIGAPQGTFVRDSNNDWHAAVGSAAPVLQGGAGKASRAGKPAPRKKGNLGVHSGPVHRADKHLPEIAALIDKEQFNLVTQPESGLLVIQGGAGSGKTTVALHRIAYLAFADKQRFRPNRILFVVPSDALLRYVKDVLPALGVRGVAVTTYANWARSQRKAALRGSGNRYNDHTPDGVVRVKKHPVMIKLLEDFVRERENEVADQIARLDPRVFTQWEKLAAEPIIPRLRRLYTWASKEAHELDVAARNAASASLKRIGVAEADILSDWADLLTDSERLRQAFDGAPGITDRDIRATVSWVGKQNDLAEDWIDSSGKAITAMDGGALDQDNPAGHFDPEDDPILLRLIQLKRGALERKDKSALRYAHVAIDEAQDRSALETKVLLETVETTTSSRSSRSVTIAGDTAQRLVFDNHFSSWQELLEHTGHSGAVVRPLRLSYRSTAEVMALARDVLGPELTPDEPIVARSGAPVELHQFGDTGEAVAFLADSLRALMGRENASSVALVTRYPEQARVFHAGLLRAEVPKLRLITRQEFSFEPGIDVTDISQVKGLEFDYVIMADVTAENYADSTESRHLLHIGATRAAHQLWLIASGKVSSLIPEHLHQW